MTTRNPGSRKGRPLFLDAGVLASSVNAFAVCLAARGHTTLVVDGHVAAARHFGHWLTCEGITSAGIDDHVLARFAAHRCRCPGGRRWRRISRRYAARVTHFVGFLQDRGEVPRADTCSEAAMPPRLATFRHHLLHERGVVPATAAKHLRLIGRVLPQLGSDPACYSAKVVRDAALAAIAAASRPDAKTVVTALRVYLRFLASRGECRTGLEHALPNVPHWRLSALPRYLPPGDVERVIASCDTSTVCGLRDRAILLLLARLGLRAGDVVHLRLDDIDWMAAALRLRGKGRRDTRLPLPQDVGDALLAYLKVRRAGEAEVEPRVFLRVHAPRRPLADSTCISTIVRYALERAGIADPPTRGANLLRHSAATALLRSGATLDAVSTLLRHRSLDTTAHYAKVDLPMLRPLAQPWPEHGPC